MIKSKILMAGFAIFAMFFGSGNIVFPLVLGQNAGTLWPWALAGFFLTAIVVPVTGLVAMVICRGRSEIFFAPVGRHLGLLVQLVLLSLLGPFGVVPRCITVSLGAMKSALPSLSTGVFITAFTLVIGLFTLRQDRVIALIAKYLTPLKVSSLLILIFVGGYLAQPIVPPSPTIPATDILTRGILSGYQTMDLLAGIFFATAIMGYLRTTSADSRILRDGLMASAVGAALLSVVYAGFMFLGAQFSTSLSGLAPEMLLPKIAEMAFGTSANIVFCLVIVISCLTTAVALTACWLDFWTTAHPRLRLPRLPLLCATLLMTAVVAFFGFSKIVAFLSPILEVLYPGLIALALVNLYRFARTRRAASGQETRSAAAALAQASPQEHRASHEQSASKASAAP